jgi:di/tricarboxylate transporter
VETRRPPASHLAPAALGIVGAMLAVMAFGILPSTTTALLAAFAMVVSGCVRLPSGYRSVNWESVILIAAMLPMATALDKTGGLDAIVTLLVDGLGGMGTLALMAGLFWAASLLSLVMSNTATAVLLAPVAVQSAEAVGASPWAFALTVAIAASSAFSTPMATPTNTMVLTPGGYRFSDYLKTGFPLQVIVFAITMLLVPLLYGTN